MNGAVNERYAPLAQFLLGASFLIVVAPVRSEDPPKATEASRQTVDRILARSTQIFAGKIVYSWTMPSRSGGEPHQVRKSVTFSGPSWLSAALPPGGHGSRLSHGDKYVEYTHVKQPDGSSRHTAKIWLPKSMDAEIRDRLLSGSYWEGKTREFLQARSGEGQRKADKDVHGVPCQVWEWAVSKNDVARAFTVFSDLTENGGTLRVYYAPQLGHIVPRIEKTGPSGKSSSIYECRDYHEDAPGIFLPRSIRDENYSSKGFLSSSEYKIESAEKINQPIADEEFKIRLPFGTEVIDSRADHQSWYRVTEDLPLTTTGLTDVEFVKVSTFWGRNRNLALLVGAALGLIVVCALALRRRWTRREAVRDPAIAARD
jgi:hypothetical protein